MIRLGDNRGSGLIAVVMALLALLTLVVAVSQSLNSTQKSLHYQRLNSELSAIQALLLNSIDCTGTLAGLDMNRPNECPGRSSPNGPPGPYLQLRRMTTSGQSLPLTGPLSADGSARFLNWDIRATCSANENTLVVRAAKKTASGQFMPDPLTGKLLDWANPGGLLVGDSALGVKPLCQMSASGVPVGVLTNETASAMRRVWIDPTTGLFNSTVTLLDDSPPTAFRLINDYAISGEILVPGQSWDGIACNQDERWVALACHHRNNRGFTGYVILALMENLPFGAKGFFDADMEKRENGCITNDHRQAGTGLDNHWDPAAWPLSSPADPLMDPANMSAIYQDDITIICARYR